MFFTLINTVSLSISNIYHIFFTLVDTDNIEGINKRSDKRNFEIKKLLSYDEWENTLSIIEKGENLFQRDIDYKKYFYIESLEERELRLRDIWLRNKEKRIEMNAQEKLNESKQNLEIRKEISDIIRGLRRQIDQYLLKNNKPIYFGNRIRFFDKEEFLYDAEINFHQIKRFLSMKSSILKNDPSIAKNYLDLMEAIQRKKIIEVSVANFERKEYYLNEKKDGKTFYSKERGADQIEGEEEEDEKKGIEEASDFLYVEVENNSKLLGLEQKDLAKGDHTLQKNMEAQAKKTKENLLAFFEEKVKESIGLKEDKPEQVTINKGRKKVKQSAVIDRDLKKKGKGKK